MGAFIDIPVHVMYSDAVEFEEFSPIFKYTSIDKAKVVVAVGGDGTLLRAFRAMVAAKNIDAALLGVNRGTLGFMSNDTRVPSALLMKVLQAYPDYTSKHIGGAGFLFSEQRHTLSVDVTYSNHKCEHYDVLNDVTLHPSVVGRLLTTYVSIYDTEACNTEVVTVNGDGIVFATASGSTAYNLSANGPILCPNMPAMVMTPLNPFTMAARSIVLPPTFELRAGAAPGVVMSAAIDGCAVYNVASIVVKLSAQTVTLLRTQSFIKAIQQKLGWNKSIK